MSSVSLSCQGHNQRKKERDRVMGKNSSAHSVTAWKKYFKLSKLKKQDVQNYVNYNKPFIPVTVPLSTARLDLMFKTRFYSQGHITEMHEYIFPLREYLLCYDLLQKHHAHSNGACVFLRFVSQVDFECKFMKKRNGKLTEQGKPARSAPQYQPLLHLSNSKKS